MFCTALQIQIQYSWGPQLCEVKYIGKMIWIDVLDQCSNKIRRKYVLNHAKKESLNSQYINATTIRIIFIWLYTYKMKLSLNFGMC